MEASVDDAEARVDLRSAIERLDVRERELLALRYGSDLTTHQIAGLMESTPKAVDLALHRTRQGLRVLLESGERSADERPLGPAPRREPRRRLRLPASR